MDEWGVRLYVRAHHEDIAWLEIRVVLEQVKDGVAENLDLACPSVARMDLDAQVSGGKQGAGVLTSAEWSTDGGAVGPHVGLNALEHRHRVIGDTTMVLGPSTPASDNKTSCISRLSRPHEARSGFFVAAVDGSSRRRIPRFGEPESTETRCPRTRQRDEEEEVHIASDESASRTST